jgi:hypothetical protein
VSNLEPRSGRRVSRKERETRAFQLIVAGGVAGTVAVVGFVLSLVGIIGAGLPVLAAIIAVVCFVMFRRAVGS